MMGPVPAVLLGISALLALRYPLTRERYAEVRAQLAIRRNTGVNPE
jgi:Na+/melibiose symporter-like transporter